MTTNELTALYSRVHTNNTAENALTTFKKALIGADVETLLNHYYTEADEIMESGEEAATGRNYATEAIEFIKKATR